MEFMDWFNMCFNNLNKYNEMILFILKEIKIKNNNNNIKLNNKYN